MRSWSALRVVGGLVVAVAMSADPAFAANYPLEFANPRAGLSTNHRFRRAYPGIEYNVRAAVVGGAYPFTYSLSNAPSGMAIDPTTGEIRWPNPQAPASPTIIVVDAEGTRISMTWSIAVTTSGFRFLDAVNGRNASGNGCSSSCGTGTISNPWRTISDMARNAIAGDFVYFRNGTYRQLDLPREGVGGPWERVSWSEDRNPVVWMAYPEHNPVIDFSYVAGSENGPLIRISGNNVYLDGFETRNVRYIGFQFWTLGGNAPTFRRMRMHTSGPGLDGTNASLIMTTAFSTPTTYLVIQDSEFFDIIDGTGNCALKLYSQAKLLVENNRFHDTDNGTEGVVALKQDMRQFTVRGNHFDVPGKAIGGNMSSYNNDETRTTHGEILFNNVRAGNYALDLNQNSQAAQIYVYRNTFVGRVQVRNTDANDGPFYFSRNVIVNNDAGTPSGSHMYHDSVSAPGRIVLSENLAGYPSANIVDSIGNLTSSYATYLGTHGHMITDQVGPRPPTNLRIIP